MFRDDTPPYWIEEWTLHDRACVELIAQARHLLVGEAAWEAAVKDRPKGRIILRHKAHVIRVHAPAEAK
jgi:hypothetical protein